MKIIILGCGSSLGSPWITNYWGKCNKKNRRNIRTRCSIFIKNKNLSILVDTSPDRALPIASSSWLNSPPFFSNSFYICSKCILFSLAAFAKKVSPFFPAAFGACPSSFETFSASSV